MANQTCSAVIDTAGDGKGVRPCQTKASVEIGGKPFCYREAHQAQAPKPKAAPKTRAKAKAKPAPKAKPASKAKAAPLKADCPTCGAPKAGKHRGMKFDKLALFTCTECGVGWQELLESSG